jgi:hypothetical protein
MFAELHGDQAGGDVPPQPPRPALRTPEEADVGRPSTPPPGEEDVVLAEGEGVAEVGASQVDLGSSGSFHGLTGISIGGVSQGKIETRPAPVAEPPAEPPALAADEEPEPVAEPEPSAKVKKPRANRPMLVGGVAGALAGGAACFALAVLNVLPVGSLQEMVGTAPEKPKAAAAPITPVASPPAPIQPAPAAPAGELFLASGDFPKALEEFQKAENPEPAGLVKRGLARWLKYSQKQAQANAPLKADDAEVTQARKDLTNANTPEGKFWLGRMDEALALSKMEQALAKGGYLAAGKQTDPVKALEMALSTAKPSGEATPALAKAVAQLKKEKADAEKRLADATQTADAEVSTLKEAVKQLAVAKGAAEAQQAKAEAARKKAAQGLEEARRALAEAKQAADQRPADAPKADAAAGTLQEVVKRLVRAKYLEPSADQTAVLKGLDRLIADTAAPAASPGQPRREGTAAAAPAPRDEPSVAAVRWADPEGSERHYSAGVRYYWLRRYADAERELQRAIGANDGDARYGYYLGLAQLAQGQRESAVDSFRRAGRLEQDQRPSRELVSESLERVQGRERGLLNRYRP